MFKLVMKSTLVCVGVALVSFSCTKRPVAVPLDSHTGMQIQCPPSGTTVNCMPAPQTNNQYCDASVRNWVNQNCTNVQYVD